MKPLLIKLAPPFQIEHNCYCAKSSNYEGDDHESGRYRGFVLPKAVDVVNKW